MKKRCKQCHKTFTVGVNGLSNGLCDSCQGIQRDNTPENTMWRPWEQQKRLEHAFTGEVKVISRDDAFGRAK